MSAILLEAREIGKYYEGHTALQGLSFQLQRGTILGLLGPNGAGKTSLIRIITQITRPDTGMIFFNQEPLSEKHLYCIGYLPEERGLYRKMSVGEQLLYLAQLKGLDKKKAKTATQEWVERLGMQGWWNKKIEELSKGMQQKVQFVATVLHQPELLILDEPFSGFDPINADQLQQEILRLNQTGTTIIFSTHRMETVENLCQEVVLIHQSKKILEGNTRAIQEKYKTHTFQLKGYGQLPLQSEYYTVLSQTTALDNSFESTIRLAQHVSANQVLQQLLPLIEIRSFTEILPSMSEIFIQVVQQANPTHSF